MRTRETLILFGAVALCAAAGLVLATQDTFAVELAPDRAAAARPATPANAPDDRPAAAAAEAVTGDHAIPVAATATRSDSPRSDTSGWTSGVVRGDIQLAVAALDRIRTISVAIEEARTAVAADGSFRNPYRAIVPVRLGAGTPTFEIRDIPFSDYPYVVSVHAPGLNGTRRTITLDAATPLVDDVVLTITTGAPLSLLLRDQDAAPHAGLDVQLLPIGEPLGRRGANGTSDNYGSIVFEDVLAGDYQVRVSRAGQPVGEPQTLTVQPGHTSFQASPRSGQGHTLVIPRGTPLEVDVSDAAGYGIADVQVTATAADRVRLTQLAATTDYAGKARFAHLLPGVWQLDIVKDGFQRTHRSVAIKADEPAPAQQVRLVRLR
jgi:hypothetical protein